MKRKFRFAILTALASLCLCLTFAACGGNGGNGGNGENGEHVHVYTETVTAPTCTEQGFTTHSCLCGDSYVDSYTDALGHDIREIAAKDPTCTEIGWEAYTGCTRCDFKENFQSIPALGHDVHSINGKSPTCTEDGFAPYMACSRCDFKNGYEFLPAHGHSMQTVAAQEPTCTEIGWEAYQECSWCHKIENYTEKSPLGHTFETYTPNGDATCLEKGTETATCIRCTVTDTREGKALGHTFETYIPNGDATCLENGTETAKCIRCTVTDTREDEDSALGHQWIENYTPKRCNAKATVHRSCSRCDTEEDETIQDISVLIYQSGRSVLNDRITTVSYTADFATGGYGELSYKWEIFQSETSETPTKVLDYSENNVVQLSNYLGLNGQVIQLTIKDDYSNYSVFRCVISEESGLPNISDTTAPVEVFEGEHDYEGVETKPTCTEQGYTTYTCADCGKDYIDDYTDPLGHEYQKDVCIRCAQHTGLLYVQSGDHYVLISMGTCTEKAIDIAEEYEGLPVTEIGNGAFKDEDSITSVKIPNSITKIGEEAFYDCDLLAEVTIQEGVPSIGDEAFSGCNNLKSITIPASVKSIGNNAFSFSGLNEVIFAPNSQLESIGQYAFSHCNLTEFTIPKSVTSIGSHAFYDCNNLATITFEDPNGWSLDDTTEIDAAQLQTPAIAVAYLTKTYCNFNWKKTTTD